MTPINESRYIAKSRVENGRRFVRDLVTAGVTGFRAENIDVVS